MMMFRIYYTYCKFPRHNSEYKIIEVDLDRNYIQSKYEAKNKGMEIWKDLIGDSFDPKKVTVEFLKHILIPSQ